MALSNAYLSMERSKRVTQLALYTIRFCRRTKDIIHGGSREPDDIELACLEHEREIIEKGLPPELETGARKKKKKGRGRKNKGSKTSQTAEAGSDPAPNPTGEHQSEELQEGMTTETAHSDVDGGNADDGETMVEHMLSDEESVPDPDLETPAEAGDYRELLDLG